MRAQRNITYFILAIRKHFLEEKADELNLEDDLTQLASGEFVKKRVDHKNVCRSKKNMA
jgi:hypothetical protein